MARRIKVRKRTESIRRYAERNPNMTQQSLARIYKVSQATINRALKRNGKPVSEKKGDNSDSGT